MQIRGSCKVSIWPYCQNTSDHCVECNTDSYCSDEHLRLLCKKGHLKEVLHALDRMSQEDILACSSIHACLLQGCIKMKNLAEGKQAHAHILKSGFKPTVFLWTSIINMYIQCNSVADARKVFDSMPERDLLCWNIMIAAYGNHGHAQEVFELFQSLILEGINPDVATVVIVLKVCSKLGNLERGKHIHEDIVKFSVKNNICVGNTLIDMYSKCGSVGDARQVFNEMPNRNVVSWTVMIAGYAKHSYFKEALRLYGRMEQKVIQPNEVTFVIILNTCAGLGDLEQGNLLFTHIMKSDIKPNIFMENTLIDMYAKCGSIDSAWHIFKNMLERDVVTWSTIIAGFARQGYPEKAFRLAQQMEQHGIIPNDVTFVSIFNAYGNLGNLEQGKLIHAYMMRSGAKPNDFVGSSLVDMYVKCGSVDSARQVFDEMPKKDVIPWNAMMSAYTNEGNARETVKAFQQMECEGVKPNETTFIIIVNICASSAILRLGQQIHACIVGSGLDTCVFLGSTLVNLYTKCGSIEEARHVFNNFFERDVVLWTAMISGYAQHGHGKEVLELVGQMQGEGVKLNGITFVGILSACSYAGLVQEGCYYFDSMIRDHEIKPTTEHYVCMVDLWGRAGCLDEAEAFIKKMPCLPDAMVWRALLSACRTFGDVERGECAAEHVIGLEPHHESAFVLLSNIYGTTGFFASKMK